MTDRVAYLNLRYTLPERIRVFIAGLKRCGYTVKQGLCMAPKDGDIFVTWNRIGGANECAKRFEESGNKVIVAENATWGNGFQGEKWYHLARNYHNTAGMFDVHGDDRWDDFGIELPPFRTEGDMVILPQRGIGNPSMPLGWTNKAVLQYGCRVRPHPGKRPSVALEDDLANAATVITWGSGAAVKALLMGCHVISKMPNWIAEQDNTVEGRLTMLRNLAWAQWQLSEIESGEAFGMLL
jgi:hypothetical protein